MQPAEPGEFGVGEAGYGAEDGKLLAVFQFGLKSDHVEQRAEFIVLTELHDGVGFYFRMVRVGEAKRLHRPVAQRFTSAFGHHFDRQATIEIWGCRLEIVERHLIAGNECIDEGFVLLFRQWAIDVVGAGSRRPCLVVARLKPGDPEIDGIAMDDGRDRVEKGERVFTGQPTDSISERRRSERAGGDNDAIPFGRRQPKLPPGEYRSVARPRSRR